MSRISRAKPHTKRRQSPKKRRRSESSTEIQLKRWPRAKIKNEPPKYGDSFYFYYISQRAKVSESQSVQSFTHWEARAFSITDSGLSQTLGVHSEKPCQPLAKICISNGTSFFVSASAYFMEFIIGTVLSDALPKINVGGVFLSTCSSSDGTGNARIRLISERMHG